MKNINKPYDQGHPAEKGMRTSILGIVANLLLGIVKWTAGYVGNSYALIADAIESLSDVAASFIVWTGLKISSQKPDQNHPYGHGKAEPLAAFLVSISLFIAAIVILLQSVKNIQTPHEVPESFTLWVLIGVILVKELLFKKVFKVGKEIQSTAVKSDAWHHRADAITSLGSLIGVSVAVIGGTGYEAADDYAAMFTSLIIIFNAIRIGRPALSEIMDIAPPAALVEKIKQIAGTAPGVKAIDKCYVRKMGFDYYVDIHVVVDGEITVREGHEIAHEVQARLLKSEMRIQGAIVHVEPFDPLYGRTGS